MVSISTNGRSQTARRITRRVATGASMVALGCSITSFGNTVAHADAAYKVVVGSSGALVRSSPDTTSRANVVGGLFDGDRVVIRCTVHGSTVEGPRGSSDLWDKIKPVKGGAAGFVHNSLIATGTRKAVAPPCADQPIGQGGDPSILHPFSKARIRTNGAPVMVRDKPSTERGRILDKYRNGQPIQISCKKYVDDRWWIKLNDGKGYVAAKYVNISTFNPMIRNCDPPRSEPDRPIAGCTDFAINQRWNVAYTWYSGKLNVSFCWTGGSHSEIYNVRGEMAAKSNFPAEAGSEVGPATESRIPIDKDDRLPDGAAIYGFFDSRTCLLGDIAPICSPWSTHKLTIRLMADGQHKYEGAT